MKTLLVGVAIAALVLVNAHEIASAGQVGSVVKPNIRTPRIIVRPRNVTPPTKRLIKKNSVEEVTNPVATQGGSAAEADSPVRSRARSPLRSRNRATAPIPRVRPPDGFFVKIGALQSKFPESGDIMALLYYVFKESIHQQNEDKKYWLNKLADRNKINDAINEYMNELTDEARKMNEKVRKAEEESKDTYRRGESIVKADDDSPQQSIGMASDTEPCLSRNC